MSERLDSLDRAKCYGMIFVIIGHVLLVSPLDIYKFPNLSKILFMYAFHMKLFFIVSGFLLFVSIDKYKDKIGLFYKNQVFRVLYPVLTSSVAYTLLLVIFTAVFGNMLWTTANEMWKPIPLQIIGGTWFLFALFIFNCVGFLIFGILIKNKNSKLSFITYVSLLIIGYFLSSTVLFKEVFPFSAGISRYIFWYFIGGFAIPFIALFFATYYNKIKYFLLFLLVYCLTYFEICNTTLNSGPIFPITTLLVFPIMTLFLIFLLSHIEIPKIDNSIKQLGQLSIQMYILQFFMIDFVWQPVYRIFFVNLDFMKGSAYFFIALIFVYAFTFIFSIAIKNSHLNLWLFGQKT